MRVAVPADKSLVEQICSHPEVRRWTAHDGAPAFNADKYLQPPNICVIVEGGCFLGVSHGAARYEAHTNFVPTGRGRNVLAGVAQAMHHMFVNTDCETILTRVPVNNPAADWVTRRAGFRYLFTRPAYWPKDGVRHDMKQYEMTVEDWVRSGTCSATGRDFHARLPEGPDHPEDPTHDAYVGALVTMIGAGNVHKGVHLYNRYALFAGYAPVRQRSDGSFTAGNLTIHAEEVQRA